MGNDICIGRTRDEEEVKLNIHELFGGSPTMRKGKTPRKSTRTQRRKRNTRQH